MSTIRATLLSVVLALSLGLGAYLAMLPLPAIAAQPAGATCPIAPRLSSFSILQLRGELNARYEHRVGLPR